MTSEQSQADIWTVQVRDPDVVPEWSSWTEWVNRATAEAEAAAATAEGYRVRIVRAS